MFIKIRKLKVHSALSEAYHMLLVLWIQFKASDILEHESSLVAWMLSGSGQNVISVGF